MSAETPPRKDDTTEPRPDAAGPPASPVPAVAAGEAAARAEGISANDGASAPTPLEAPPLSPAVEAGEIAEVDDEEGQEADAGTQAQGLATIAGVVRTHYANIVSPAVASEYWAVVPANPSAKASGG